MSSLRGLPELVALDTQQDLVRIPPELDVPLTPRVRRLMDQAAFRRLSKISQLGLVSLVYPAAIHTRFEHSLGVYRLALLYLRRLSYDERFAKTVTPEEAERFLVCSLLHDLGHWPFCHPMEDMRLPEIPRHEVFASELLSDESLAAALRHDWGLTPRQIEDFLADRCHGTAGRLLSSMLSGPVDIDKLDYLQRDSLHAGVPYGRQFDQNRLIGSLCVNAAGDGLAISEKGKTAAEMLVFARYVMFSEVYWHHGVRAATAMLQRAVYWLLPRVDVRRLFRLTEGPFVAELLQIAAGQPASVLLEGLFGEQRRLYKRLAQYSLFEGREYYERLARRPFPELAAFAVTLAETLSSKTGIQVFSEELLVDAPPVRRESGFKVDVLNVKTHSFRRLEEVSPIAKTLAQEPFDDYVKKVRIFVHPRVAAELHQVPRLKQALTDALEEALAG